MDLVKLSLNNGYNLQLYFNGWLLVLIIVFLGFWYLISTKRFCRKVFEIDEAEIGIGNQKLKIKPNYEDIQIAYKLWVELSTRKIGLPIDFNNDVIDEIYNSWYEFFKLTRELIKDIPVHKIKKNESTRILVNAAIDVLNEGLRPHLTQWNAKFRKWYKIENAKPENVDAPPQEMQKRYPHYSNLVDSMQQVNNRLIKYREKMKRIALDL